MEEVSPSGYLMRELFTEQIEESHPIWGHVESNDYLLEFRKTTRFFSCDGQSETRHGEPYFQGYRVRDTWLRDPVGCVSSILQEQGLSLQQSDVHRIASFMVSLSNRIGPGTRVMAVAEVCVCEIIHFDVCPHDTSSGSEDQTMEGSRSSELSEPEMLGEVELNSNWAQATYDMFSQYGSTTSLDEITQWLSGGRAGDDAAAASSGMKNRLAWMRYDGTGDDTCPICLDEFSHGDEFLRTACSHNFHQRCIGNWMIGKANCPLCRAHIQI